MPLGVVEEVVDNLPLVRVDYMLRQLLDDLSDHAEWLKAAPFGGDYDPDPLALPPGYEHLPVEE